MEKTITLAHQIWTAAFGNFRSIYEEVAEAGVRSVVLAERRGEFNLLVPEQARQAGRVLEQLGLRVCACHGSETYSCDLSVRDDGDHAAMLRTHATLMENVAELGCKTYVVHLGPAPQDGAKEAAWQQVRKAVEALGAKAEALGMALALENGLPGYLASNEELIAFADDYAHPAVALCYDSGHAHITGEAAQVLRMMSRHVVTVHLHDNLGAEDQHLIPGLGTIDFRPVAEALAECPRLIHAETEAANYAGWPHALPLWSQKDLWARYLQVLNMPGTGVTYA